MSSELRLRVGAVAVMVRCADAGLAMAAAAVFTDLADPGSSDTGDRVVFDVFCRPSGEHRWSITRDGAPCEMTLSDDGVLPHLQWELNRLMIESNPVSVHAAAVATADGRGVLIPGRSCSGKSTLAGWMSAVHGFGYLGDEVGAINTAGVVLPFPRPVGVRVESPLAGLVDDWAGEFERVMPISRLGGRVHNTGVPVALIVFPRFTADAAPVWAPVHQADCLMRLAELTPGLGVHGRPVFEQLSQLARTVPAVDMVYGNVTAAAEIVAGAFR